MNKSIALLVIGLVLGGLTGFMFAAAYGITLDGHDHSHNVAPSQSAAAGGTDHHADHGKGGHGKVKVLPKGPDAPTIDISIAADPMSGWNLHIETKNFRFAPENASRNHVPGEGHAHVYVNGQKIARHYGPWLHIPTLPSGTNVIHVMLSSNDHMPLSVEEAPLHAERTVVVK